MNATVSPLLLLSPLKLRGRRQPGLWMSECVAEAEVLAAPLRVNLFPEVDR
jgi:hypothetical protein